MLRLAASLHIIQFILGQMLKENGHIDEITEVPEIIQLSRIEQAIKMYGVIQQQKSVFIQVIFRKKIKVICYR